jgi:hypothetical protein
MNVTVHKAVSVLDTWISTSNGIQYQNGFEKKIGTRKNNFRVPFEIARAIEW